MNHHEIPCPKNKTVWTRDKKGNLKLSLWARKLGCTHTLSRRWSMLAYTGIVVERANGVPLVLDLSGVRLEQQLALLWDHGQRIGTSDQVHITARGLEASGSLQDSEQTDRVLRRADAGRPLMASLQATALRVEMLDCGQVAIVNGRQVTGRVRIYREWSLDELTVTPNPADHSTAFVLPAACADPFVSWPARKPRSRSWPGAKLWMTDPKWVPVEARR